MLERKRQIRPEEQAAVKTTEPFSTKKLWESTRKKAVTLTHENENGEIGESVNPSNHTTPLTVSQETIIYQPPKNTNT